MYDCPSRVSPTGDLALNPDMCPDWESNQSPSCLQAGTQSTEPHRPGQEAFSIVMAGVGASGLSLEYRGPGCCQTPTVPRIGPWQGVHARTGSQEGYPLPNQVPGEAALSVLVPECLSFPICEMGRWCTLTPVGCSEAGGRAVQQRRRRRPLVALPTRAVPLPSLHGDERELPLDRGGDGNGQER